MFGSQREVQSGEVWEPLGHTDVLQLIVYILILARDLCIWRDVVVTALLLCKDTLTKAILIKESS